MDIDPNDTRELMKLPAFRRFFFSAIQAAGVLGEHSLADGLQERDLRFHEGRRSLGFEMLMAADLAQPEPLQTPNALATLDAVIREAMNPQEKLNGRRSNHRTDDTARYGDLGAD